MARVIVIGAGAMGLAATYRAAKNGHEVHLVEASTEPGGMAGHFDFAGTSIERFYHFICKTDDATFDLMRELGTEKKLRWRNTTMGLFTGGKLHDWGNPVALLTNPVLGPIEKLRYALFAFVSVRKNNWAAIEPESARTWIKRWCGESVYNRLWKPLFDYKFYGHSDKVSATWIWTRIRRIGRSRDSLMKESLGYIEGGTMTLVDDLIAASETLGARLHLGTPVTEVTTENGRVTGVQTPAGHMPADFVISTVPTPLVSAMVPSLPAEWKQKFDAIENIACICVVFRLKRAVTPHFWVNISEPGVEIPGVIEFSNLRDVGGDSIVYIPYYMPATNEKFRWADEALVSEAFATLKMIQPALSETDIVATNAARLRYGQPVCEPDFAKMLPPVQTPIAGLQIADTCYYYPEDRGICESLRLGQKMAVAIDTGEPVHSVRSELIS